MALKKVKKKVTVSKPASKPKNVSAKPQVKGKPATGTSLKKVGSAIKNVASNVPGVTETFGLISAASPFGKGKVTGKRRRRMQYTNQRALNRSSRRLKGFVKAFKKHASALGYTVERKAKNKSPGVITQEERLAALRR